MVHGPYARVRCNALGNSLEESVIRINELLEARDYLSALDLIELISDRVPDLSTTLLAQAYDILQNLPDKETRYSLYQSRYYDFPIKQGDRVLDIGSGHLPLPMATHLADLAIDDHDYGRAGAPFKYVEGKPVYNCSVEDMPFEDRSFDFVYCSHVLEHVANPIQACKELMRVGRRGYLETPSRAKDLFLNTAKISNHKWMVEYFNKRLVFTEYDATQLVGLASDLLMSMHCAPQTDREKAFSAMILLKSDQLNTMLMWEEGFDVEVRYLGKATEFYYHETRTPHFSSTADVLTGAIRLIC